jgi:hypothetical protein
MKSAYGINRCHGAFITAVKNAKATPKRIL